VKLHVFVFPRGLELEEFQLVDGSADPHQMAFTLQLERTNFAGNSWGSRSESWFTNGNHPH
jgi:hypothetical protein